MKESVKDGWLRQQADRRMKARQEGMRREAGGGRAHAGQKRIRNRAHEPLTCRVVGAFLRLPRPANAFLWRLQPSFADSDLPRPRHSCNCRLAIPSAGAQSERNRSLQRFKVP